jgi:RNA polymerase sigma factor (sigma-70 family)
VATSSRTKTGWRALESLFDAGALGGLTDGELLECFQTSRDTLGHEAFRILVERHGPMVLGLCRSLVRDPHEADDAFQATFLVFLRKAESIRRRDTLGPWLHGVAGRVARRARQRATRRMRLEVEANDQIPCPAGRAPESPSVEEIVQDEIARLPASFRSPVVLCCLEGLSYDLAAHRLGVSEPTLRGRLYRARKQLASQLRRRGITTGAFASAVGPARLTLPALPESLVETTVQFSIRWTSVTGLLSGAAVIPDSIAGLAQGAMKTMLLQSLKLSGIGVLLSAGVLGTIVAAQSGQDGGGNSGAQTAPTPAAKAQSAPNNRSERDAAERKALNQRQMEIHQQRAAEKTRQVEKQLDLVIDANLPEGTTLEQLLKYIKQKTTEAIPPGIPIYVNPIGVEEANKNMQSAVAGFSKKAPVRVILEHALLGTGLSFTVGDGFLMIDSRTGILERRVADIDHKLNRVLEALDRLEKAK